MFNLFKKKEVAVPRTVIKTHLDLWQERNA